LKLPRCKAIADHRVECDFERNDSIEECFLRWLEQRQVCFIINHLDFGGGFFSRLGTFQLHVILIRNQVRGHQDMALRQNSADSTLLRSRTKGGPSPIIRITKCSGVSAKALATSSSVRTFLPLISSTMPPRYGARYVLIASGKMFVSTMTSGCCR